MTTSLRFDQEAPLRLDDLDSYVVALQMLYQEARVSLPRSTGACTPGAGLPGSVIGFHAGCGSPLPLLSQCVFHFRKESQIP
jgi:hypothetical protein